MMHVTDELELYALGALAPVDAARVAAHLSECPVCREQARAIEEVVQELPDTLPARDVPARLRERILATARADISRAPSPRRKTSWTGWRRPATIGLAGLTVAVAALAYTNVRLEERLSAVMRERDDSAVLAAIPDRIKEAGRWWYMVGKDEWKDAGGVLIAPRTDSPPFVLFNDLPALAPGRYYTVWFVSADSTWVRGAAFRPNGKALQAVDLTVPIAGFERCAVTVEESEWGRRTGSVIMESRIAQPATPAQ